MTYITNQSMLISFEHETKIKESNEPPAMLPNHVITYQLSDQILCILFSTVLPEHPVLIGDHIRQVRRGRL